MNVFVAFLVRVILLAAGLVLALLLACLFLVLLGAWSLRAAWYRLTGRPVMPFVMRRGPRDVFEEMRRRAGAQPAGRPADTHERSGRRAVADVTDVEPKE